MDATFAHRPKVLHLEACSHPLAATIIVERPPGTDVRSAADSGARRLALCLGEVARGECRLPPLVPGGLLRVRHALSQDGGLLHRDRVRSRLGEVVRSCVPAAAIDRLEGPLPLRDMVGGCSRERVIARPLLNYYFSIIIIVVIINLRHVPRLRQNYCL